MPATLASVLSPKGAWGLALAYRAAAIVIDEPRQAGVLVRLLFSADAELRRHAADAARRVTEKQPDLLRPYAQRVLGALAQSTGDDWRMLAHTGLVAARIAHTRAQRLRRILLGDIENGSRIAHTRAQRLRAAGLLRPLLHDPSNVVRCTAVEGLGLLASLVPELRAEVEPILEEALVSGTPGMRCRARAALVCLR